MAFLERYLGGQKLSIVNDPFKVSKVKRIYVSYQKEYFEEGWFATGEVEFQNGDTEGKQKFKGETFDAVVTQIKAFVQALDN